jgi:hypothetical protein
VENATDKAGKAQGATAFQPSLTKLDGLETVTPWLQKRLYNTMGCEEVKHG